MLCLDNGYSSDFTLSRLQMFKKKRGFYGGRIFIAAQPVRDIQALLVSEAELLCTYREDLGSSAISPYPLALMPRI